MVISFRFRTNNSFVWFASFPHQGINRQRSVWSLTKVVSFIFYHELGRLIGEKMKSAVNMEISRHLNSSVSKTTASISSSKVCIKDFILLDVSKSQNFCYSFYWNLVRSERRKAPNIVHIKLVLKSITLQGYRLQFSPQNLSRDFFVEYVCSVQMVDCVLNQFLWCPLDANSVVCLCLFFVVCLQKVQRPCFGYYEIFLFFSVPNF